MNPWLEIPLEEYEAHMAMESIGQAQYLADCLGRITRELAPSSVAVIGCSGGNGFDRIDPSVVERVVGIDFNPHYVAAARIRYQYLFHRLELVCADILDEGRSFARVDLAFAGLIFEYIDLRKGLQSIRKLLTPRGHLFAVLQLPDERIAAVSPSPYTSLNKLEHVLEFVDPPLFEQQAAGCGFSVLRSESRSLPSGKRFHEALLRAEA